MKIYNTLTRKKEEFAPIEDKKVGLYTCGPTVYWFAHIGNLRTYIFEDILKRVLRYNGYNLKHVMNITDVGHLTSDSDSGEDKLEKGAKKEKKTVWEIAQFYTDKFKEDMAKLNIREPDIWIKATDTIAEQIDLIKVLEEKGFVYEIENDGMYFDTSKLKTYGRLWDNKKDTSKESRIGAKEGKRNPEDFALWKFSPKDEKRQMEWDSPWGVGFPGWHTECVVMGIKNLGIPFDIHCGGIDHVDIHHTNEIAQAEAAYGKVLSNYWMHSEHLILKEGKMSKSQQNIVTVCALIEKGFSPLAFRYLTLMSHYKTRLTFDWDTLQAAQNSLDNLYQKALELKSDLVETENTLKYKKEFKDLISDDLDTPRALALTWTMLKDGSLNNSEKYSLLLDFDKIFALDIKKAKEEEIPEEIQKLAQLRQQRRKERDFEEADRIRDEILRKGYIMEDSKEGIKIKKAP